MARQQTRYTYPIVRSRPVRLYLDTLQKHVTPGQIVLDAPGTYVDVWRYTGDKRGHRNMGAYNPVTRTWNQPVPMKTHMGMRGWTFVERRTDIKTDSDKKAIYFDINTGAAPYSRPGYYMDMWHVKDWTIGKYITPIEFFFRLESRIFAPSSEPTGSWFDLKITPTGIPFQSTEEANQDFPLAIGVIPIVKNLPDSAAYQQVKAMISSCYIEISEIWFYTHEIDGAVKPPRLVFPTLPSHEPVVFDEQVFNIFYGKISPSLFPDPGVYRVKIKVGFDAAGQAGWMSHSMYHDFWKTFTVGRNRTSIGEIERFCFPGTNPIPAGRGLCSMVVAYDGSDTSLAVRGDSDVSNFHEPGRTLELDAKPASERRSFHKFDNFPVVLSGFSGTTSFDLQLPEGASIDYRFPPLFTSGGRFIQPQLPFDGTVQSNGFFYDIDGTKIITSFNMAEDEDRRIFASIVAPSDWSGGVPFGAIKTSVFHSSDAIEIGSVYSFGANTIGSSGRFLMAFLVHAEIGQTPVRIVLPASAFSVSPAFELQKSFIDAVVPTVGGVRNYQVQFYYSQSGTDAQMKSAQAAQIVSTIFRSANKEDYTYRLTSEPDTGRFAMMVFLGSEPMIRGHDYILQEGGKVIKRLYRQQADAPMYVYYGTKS